MDGKYQKFVSKKENMEGRISEMRNHITPKLDIFLNGLKEVEEAYTIMMQKILNRIGNLLMKYVDR